MWKKLLLLLLPIINIFINCSFVFWIEFCTTKCYVCSVWITWRTHSSDWNWTIDCSWNALQSNHSRSMFVTLLSLLLSLITLDSDRFLLSSLSCNGMSFCVRAVLIWLKSYVDERQIFWEKLKVLAWGFLNWFIMLSIIRTLKLEHNYLVLWWYVGEVPPLKASMKESKRSSVSLFPTE
jgi:hypothetical protein